METKVHEISAFNAQNIQYHNEISVTKLSLLYNIPDIIDSIEWYLVTFSSLTGL